MRSTFRTALRLATGSAVACLAGCGADVLRPFGEHLVPPPEVAVFVADGPLQPPALQVVVVVPGVWTRQVTPDAFVCRRDSPWPGTFHRPVSLGLTLPLFHLTLHAASPSGTPLADVTLDLPAPSDDSTLWIEVMPNIGNPFPPDQRVEGEGAFALAPAARRSPNDSLWIRWFRRDTHEVWAECDR